MRKKERERERKRMSKSDAVGSSAVKRCVFVCVRVTTANAEVGSLEKQTNKTHVRILPTGSGVYHCTRKALTYTKHATRRQERSDQRQQRGHA